MRVSFSIRLNSAFMHQTYQIKVSGSCKERLPRLGKVKMSDFLKITETVNSILLLLTLIHHIWGHQNCLIHKDGYNQLQGEHAQLCRHLSSQRIEEARVEIRALRIRISSWQVLHYYFWIKRRLKKMTLLRGRWCCQIPQSFLMNSL